MPKPNGDVTKRKTISYIVQMHWNNIVNNIVGIVKNIIYM